MAFDLLALNGSDLRSQPLHRRRRQLERVAGKWSPPLELCPATTDRDEAMGWFEDYRVAGIEGLVAKAADGRYSPGSRDWVKIKHRQSTELIVGAVTGTLAKPTALIGGRVDHGRLIIVGRSTALTAAQSAQLGDELAAAGARSPVAGRDLQRRVRIRPPYGDRQGRSHPRGRGSRRLRDPGRAVPPPCPLSQGPPRSAGSRPHDHPLGDQARYAGTRESEIARSFSADWATR